MHTTGTVVVVVVRYDTQVFQPPQHHAAHLNAGSLRILPFQLKTCRLLPLALMPPSCMVRIWVGVTSVGMICLIFLPQQREAVISANKRTVTIPQKAPTRCQEPAEVQRTLRSEALEGGGFSQPGFHVWGGSVALGDDGLYHMFVSRWPRSAGPNGWVVACEIVRAESMTPGGPYSFRETVIGPRKGLFWDNLSAHNPTIHWDERSKKFALFYIGTSSNSSILAEPTPPERQEYERAWNTKRIGLATAPSILGPWKRSAAPILQPRAGEWDASITSNPAAWVFPNGSVLLLYKSMRLKYPERNNAKMRSSFHLGAAFAPHLLGPYRRLSSTPILFSPDSLKPLAAEDPYVWHCGGRYHLLFKAMQFLKSCRLRSGQLAYTSSVDLKHWNPPVPAFNRTFAWRSPNSPTSRYEKVDRLERPQALVVDGRLKHVFCASVTATQDARNIAMLVNSE